MDNIKALVWLGLIVLFSRDGESLLNSDSQDVEFNFPTPHSSGKIPSLDSPPLGGIIGSLERGIYDNYPAEDQSPFPPVKGNIRKSFSLYTTTKPSTTPHYEALTNDSNNNYHEKSLSRVYFINNKRFEDENPQDLIDRFKELKKGQNIYSGRTTRIPQNYENTYEEKLKLNRDLQSPFSSGPNLNLQPLPIRHWSTESNVIREDEIRGSSTPYSFSTASPTTPRPYNPRGNIRYTVHTTERPRNPTYNEDFEPTRSGKNIATRLFSPNIDYRNAYIVPTTYRPPYTGSPRDSYAFSFRNQDQSRQKNDDTNGNFRGSVKYLDTLGRDQQTDYVANPGEGLVTSETPFVTIGGRAGQRYIPPISTPRPYTPDEQAYSYSYRADEPSSTTFAYNGYRIGKSGGLVTTVAPLYIYPTTISTKLPPPDGSYVFSYNAGDHQRHEVRDKNGNVRGMYSFDGTDGEKKLVHYIANAENGFVAQGTHIPIQQGGISPLGGQFPTDLSTPGGAYSFSYNGGDHIRHEIRDDAGNVQGSFGLITGDVNSRGFGYEIRPVDVYGK